MTQGERMIWAAVFASELSKMRLARGTMPRDHIAASGAASYAVKELRSSVESTEDMHGVGSGTVAMLKAMLAADEALPDSTEEWAVVKGDTEDE